MTTLAPEQVSHNLNAGLPVYGWLEDNPFKVYEIIGFENGTVAIHANDYPELRALQPIPLNHRFWRKYLPPHATRFYCETETFEYFTTDKD